MTEIIFLAEEDIDSGYIARSLSEPIFTQADDLIELRERVKDAVHCHFLDEQNRPKLIRLHPYERMPMKIDSPLVPLPPAQVSPAWAKHPQP